MSITENTAPSTDSMHPDPGCYEEPYRLTWQVAVVITVGLFSIAAGVGSVSSTVVAGLTLAGLGVLMAAPLASLIVTRRIAFRTDREGITFGPQPVPFAPGRRFFGVSVPWKDVKEIRLYKEPIRGGGSGMKFIRTVPRHRGNAAAGQSLWLAYCHLDVTRPESAREDPLRPRTYRTPRWCTAAR